MIKNPRIKVRKTATTTRPPAHDERTKTDSRLPHLDVRQVPVIKARRELRNVVPFRQMTAYRRLRRGVCARQIAQMPASSLPLACKFWRAAAKSRTSLMVDTKSAKLAKPQKRWRVEIIGRWRQKSRQMAKRKGISREKR